VCEKSETKASHAMAVCDEWHDEVRSGQNEPFSQIVGKSHCMQDHGGIKCSNIIGNLLPKHTIKSGRALEAQDSKTIHLDTRRKHTNALHPTVSRHIVGSETVLRLNLSACEFGHVVGCEVRQNHLTRAMGMEIT